MVGVIVRVLGCEEEEKEKEWELESKCGGVDFDVTGMVMVMGVVRLSGLGTRDK